MKDKLKIRLLRLGNGLDQHQVAGKLNIPVAAYSKIENGLTALTPELSEQMARIFGRSLKDLDGLPEISNTWPELAELIS